MLSGKIISDFPSRLSSSWLKIGAYWDLWSTNNGMMSMNGCRPAEYGCQFQEGQWIEFEWERVRKSHLFLAHAKYTYMSESMACADGLEYHHNPSTYWYLTLEATSGRPSSEHPASVTIKDSTWPASRVLCGGHTAAGAQQGLHPWSPMLGVRNVITAAEPPTNSDTPTYKRSSFVKSRCLGIIQ
jgi:hypothetical protein